MPAEAGEEARARMLELFPGGFEEAGDDTLELAAYTDEDGEARARAVFGRVESKPVEPGWEDRWREFHRPVRIGPLWIGPPWETPDPNALAIVIDPGQAFGTGTHPTTRLCLELMLELEPRGSLVDLGCGSGVLAIAAAKLGFEPVVALDSDRAAIAATRANARDNGVVLDRVERFDLRHEPAPRADVVVANLMRPLLLSIAPDLQAPTVVASGLLDHEADEISAAFGRREQKRLSDRGWTALLLRAG